MPQGQPYDVKQMSKGHWFKRKNEENAPPTQVSHKIYALPSVTRYDALFIFTTYTDKIMLFYNQCSGIDK
jgi:hypothetical protein